MRHPSRLVKAQLPRAGMLWLLALLVICSTATAAAGSVSDDLAGPLRALAAASAEGRIAPASVTNLVRIEHGLAQVEILFSSDAAAATTDLGAYGGQVQIRMDRRVQALLPPSGLNAVAALPQVIQVRLPNRVWSLQGFGATSSEGVQMTLATAMHANGIVGEGVKLAVIDTGFAGYAAAQIPGVADGTRTRTFGSASLTAGAHGTAVAEVVADMSPGAEIWLLAVDTELAFEEAVEFVRDNGFDIAVASLGAFSGPFDGTHPISRKINRASQVLWVIAAGNHARRHYEGTWTDRNNDRFHEWGMGDQDLNVVLSTGVFTAHLSWFQTAGATTNRDYDLVLFDATGREVTRSAVTQKGDDPPSETLVAYIPEAGIYSLRIQRMFSDAIPATDRFKLFVPDVDIEAIHRVVERSLTIPAEAAGAFTIGAIRGSQLLVGDLPILSLDEIEEFSSRGPSLAGLLKPDMVAPNVVSTGVAGYNPFVGTSAAAPHAAGAAALLLSEDSQRTPAVIVETLKRFAVTDRLARDPSGQPIPDNTYGHGRIRLRVGIDTIPPTISISFPRNGTTITDATPTVIASITDVGIGVDPASIQVRIDGNAVDFEYNPNTGLLTYTVPADTPLTRSSHTLTIDASDLDGNRARTAVSNFRVAAPAIDAGLHLISLPYADLANVDPADVFGLPHDQVQMARWVPEDVRAVKYHVWPDEYASFSPPDARGANPIVAQPPIGLGYFVRLPKRSTIALGAGGALVNAESYQIRLLRGAGEHQGWNMIGNPFEGPVDWGTVTFIADGQRYDLREAMSEDVGITEGVLFGFVSTPTGGYYNFSADPVDATMEFMKGYWLHVLRDTTLIIYNPAVGLTGGAGRVRPAVAPAAAGKDEWTVRISARSGEYADPVNYIGVHPQATDGYDLGLDVTKPPAMAQQLSLYMLHRDGGPSARYARDLRSSITDRQEWDVEVATTLRQAPVTLTWEDLNNTVPNNVRLVLRDLDAGRDVYMRTTSSYVYYTGDGPETRRLKIIATVDQPGGLAVSNLNTAGAADGTVTITYTLTRAATVTADIRNIAGVPIARLASSEATGGMTQTLSWNGRNSSGARVPTGRYLVRLTARTPEGQSVQALALFDKVR